ncbi:MAG: DUF3623 family protein [Chloroflexales bacterium]|nr:DUF3623 family protein [Chloroflexales bacterium]
MPHWLAAYTLPALFALVLWWLSTGVLMWLAHRPLATVRAALWGLGTLALLLLYVGADGRNDATLAGTYAAFGWATLAWGWLVLSYYGGVITGVAPTRPAPRAVWPRFCAALCANAHHDLLAAALLLLLVVVHRGAVNPLGLYTFVALWVMHTSARLLVFAGVPTFNDLLLPPRFRRQMAGLWQRRRFNALFLPVIVASIALDVLLVRWAAAAALPDAASLTMLACMVSLGIIEQALLMSPWELPLWNWTTASAAPALPAPPAPPVPAAPRMYGTD